MTVVGLGAAPGGWSQVASRVLGVKGRLIASGILPMDGVSGVAFIQGDFIAAEGIARMARSDRRAVGRPCDFRHCPQYEGREGCRAGARHISVAADVPGAASGRRLPIKIFQGEGIDVYRKQVRELFDKVQMRKPSSSRDRWRRQYVLAGGFRGA